MTAGGAEELESVRDVLRDVQRFIGTSLGTAWPAETPLPSITQPIHEMVEHHLDQDRAELLVVSDAFPAPGVRRVLGVSWNGCLAPVCTAAVRGRRPRGQRRAAGGGARPTGWDLSHGPSLAPRVQQPARDDEALDVRRALLDLLELRVAHPLLDRILARVA